MARDQAKADRLTERLAKFADKVNDARAKLADPNTPTDELDDLEKSIGDWEKNIAKWSSK